MSLNALGLVALLATQAPEPAPTPPTPSEIAGKAYFDHLRMQLRTSPSARERALSARMSFDDPKAGGRVLRQAAQAAPTDPLVQFLWTTVGTGEWSGCDAASACPEQVMAWARIEPDNGLAWLPPFNDVYRSGDGKAIDEAIARIARAPGYDDHVVDAWLALRGAIGARPMPAAVVEMALKDANMGAAHRQADAVGITAMAFAAALPIPLNSLGRACRRESQPGVAEARFENCARIGRALMGSDVSVLMKGLGASLVHASGLENAADREAKRLLDWRLQASVEAMNRPNGAEGYFADLASTRSETRAQELLLARRGTALEPPKDWKGRGR